MFLNVLILGLAYAGHQTIIQHLGASYEEIDEFIKHDHEIKADFLTPIVIDLPNNDKYQARVFISYFHFNLW